MRDTREREGQAVLVELILGEDAAELDEWEQMALHEVRALSRQKRGDRLRRHGRQDENL